MQWLASKAHNLEVVGSSPTPATMALSNNWFSSPAFQVGNSGSSPDSATTIWDHRSVVRTPACHAGGAGSIPAGPAKFWARGAIGSATALQAEGYGFESRPVHEILICNRELKQTNLSISAVLIPG